MYRLALVLASPLLLAFAPVPVIKPMTDPDKAIQQFDQETRSRDEASVAERKSRLVARVKELHLTLAKRGWADQAEAVRERLVLLESIDVNKPLGEGAVPGELLRRASAGGKYRHLLHVLYVPADRGSYSEFNDFGLWPGTSYLSYGELKHGHWVYSYPRWYVWRDGPPRP
ncbi:MAG: hypothetical protein U0797_10595 [Gemmataceae bacterium]